MSSSNVDHVPSPAVFLSALAQQDNLGDLVLRRAALQMISRAGAVPHVLTGRMEPSFIAALELPSGAQTYHSTRTWTTTMLRSSARRHHLMFSPGPQRLDLTPRSLGHACSSFATAAAVRRRGGRVVKLGRSLSGPSSLLLRLERALISSTDVYSLRDQRSAELLRRPAAIVGPDIALADAALRPSEGGNHRRLAALSFRGDRFVDLEVLRAVVVRCRQRGLEPVVVTQVARDNHFHEELARMLACEVQSWPEDRTHAEQLMMVLETYQHSGLVVSNRLHPLIFALAAGATPLGLTGATDLKVRTTLNELQLGHRVWDRPGSVPDGLIAAEDLSIQTAEIRVRLAALEERVAAVIA